MQITMSEDFIIHKPHKMMDWVYQQVTDWISDAVTEWFQVQNIGDLSREQIEEVIVEWNKFIDQDEYAIIAYGLRETISIWEMENEEEIDL